MYAWRLPVSSRSGVRGPPAAPLGPDGAALNCALTLTVPEGTLKSKLHGGSAMIVLRFKMLCRPEKTEELRRVLAQVIAPSRAVAGVIAFDIAQDLADPNVFIATEVFEDDAARDRQESLPEVTAVMAMFPDSLAADPEATLYRVESSEDAT